jgi:glycosyltransferase involved in cell wall biosynthesis
MTMNQHMIKRPLNILHLMSSVSVGGTQRGLLDLVNQTDEPTACPHILVFCKKNDASTYMSEFQALDIPFHQILQKRFYDPRVVRGIVSYARRHHIDLIHTHLVDADIVGSVAGQLLRIPVISTLHNSPRAYKNKRLHRKWPGRFAANYLTTHLVALSEEIRRHFIARWQISPERISTIVNGRDISAFLSIPEGTGGNGPFIITNIGSLSPQKAQDVLLDASKLVLARQPQTQFLIVGQGALAQELAAKAEALGIANQVEFTALRRDVPQILARSDIFVLSSMWEGLPQSAIEAMAAARPVVLTDVGGNRELVETGVTGVIVPPGDAEALAEEFIMLMNDAPKRALLGHAARQKVQERFAVTRVVREYEELYLQVWMKYHG